MKKRWISLILAVIMIVSLLGTVPALAEEIPDMKISDKFLEVLKQMEGFYPYPQWDYAQWTVGYGTRCPDDKLNYWTKGDPNTPDDDNPITEEEALALLDAEMSNYEIPVNKFIKKYGLKLEQHQYDALISFSYNCGTGWTLEETGYLNTAVRQGDMSNALIYGLCLWSTAGGNYILIPRRLSEANMYINGEYKSYTEGNSYPASFKYVFLDGNGGTAKYTIHGYNAADPAGIVTDFKDIPTGVDANGNWFVYEFAGWFTEPTGGTQVTVLDGSLTNGTILYAQWKDPSGQIVPLMKGEAVPNLSVNVTANVNVRTGPGTYFPVNYTIQATADAPKTITVTEVFTSGSTTWGRFADGWLSLSYTNYDDVVNSLPDDSFPKAGTLQVAAKYRTEPAVRDDTLVGEFAKGDRVTIVEEFNDGAGLIWGKMDNGYWVCVDYKGTTYVQYDEDISPVVESVSMMTLPTKLQYVQKNEELNITGSVLLVRYSDGSVKARTLARELTKGFDNTTLGQNTVTVRYLGKETTFAVEIIKATVTFKNYDGTVLSQQQYAYGEAVTAPGMPVKPEDELGAYRFIGWDKEVTACNGNAEYVAQFEMIPGSQKYTPGDINGDTAVNKDDAFYLLYSLVWGQEEYPMTAPADFDSNGLVNKDDAFYLLYHLVWGEAEYPLTK